MVTIEQATEEQKNQQMYNSIIFIKSDFTKEICLLTPRQWQPTPVFLPGGAWWAAVYGVAQHRT